MKKKEERKQYLRPPCKKDCTGRGPGCGIECEAWQEYIKSRAERYEDQQEEYRRRKLSDYAERQAQRRNYYAKTNQFLRGGKK